MSNGPTVPTGAAPGPETATRVIASPAEHPVARVATVNRTFGSQYSSASRSTTVIEGSSRSVLVWVSLTTATTARVCVAPKASGFSTLGFRKLSCHENTTATPRQITAMAADERVLSARARYVIAI